MLNQHPPLFRVSTLFLGLVFLIVVSSANLSTGYTAVPLTAQQSQEFNHFVELNQQFRALKTEHPEECSPSAIQHLENLTDYMLAHPFILTYLKNEGYLDVPSNLLIHRGQCYRLNHQNALAEHSLKNAQQHLSEDIEINRFFYNEYAQVLKSQKNWSELEALLTPWVHSKQFKTLTFSNQQNLLSWLKDGQIGQRHFKKARLTLKALQLSYQTSPPAHPENIAVIASLIKNLNNHLNDTNTEHYIYQNQKVSHRWDDNTTTLAVYLDKRTLKTEWTESRINSIKKSLTVWQEALKPIRYIEIVFTNNPNQADVHYRLVKHIQTDIIDEGIEPMGVNLAKTQDGKLLENDIELSLYTNDEHYRTDEEFYAVALHEAGHMMGLYHSGSINDVMAETSLGHYDIQQPSTLSSRDIASIQYIYQHPAKSYNNPSYPLHLYGNLIQQFKETEDLIFSHHHKQAEERCVSLIENQPHLTDSHYLNILNHDQADQYQQALQAINTYTTTHSQQSMSPITIAPEELDLLIARTYIKAAIDEYNHTIFSKKKAKAYRKKGKALLHQLVNDYPELSQEKQDSIKSLLDYAKTWGTTTQWGWERRSQSSIIYTP